MLLNSGPQIQRFSTDEILSYQILSMLPLHEPKLMSSGNENEELIFTNE